MKLSSILIFVLAGFVLNGALASLAQASAIAEVGSALTFENASNGREYTMRQPFSLRAGYRFPRFDAYLEYTDSTMPDGRDAVRLTRHHHEWIGWAKLPIGSLEKTFSLFIAGGFGLQYEEVDTTFLGETDHQSGRAAVLTAGALGVHVKADRHWMFDLESRIATSEGYNPNPQIGVGFYAGRHF